MIHNFYFILQYFCAIVNHMFQNGTLTLSKTLDLCDIFVYYRAINFRMHYAEKLKHQKSGHKIGTSQAPENHCPYVDALPAEAEAAAQWAVRRLKPARITKTLTRISVYTKDISDVKAKNALCTYALCRLQENLCQEKCL